MHHKCYSCANFTEYYCKQNNRFAMTGCGNCKIKNGRVSRHSTCKEFEIKPEPSQANLNAIIEKFEEVVTELNGIKLILDERAED